MSDVLESRYPRLVDNQRGRFEICLMQATDAGDALAFARTLPEHDLLFLPRNITVPKVLAAWMNQLDKGAIASLVVMHQSRMVGFSAVVSEPRSWSKHVGELRVLIAPDVRDTGIGRVLIQESFLLAISRDLEKLTAQMTMDQKGAIAVFQDLGFIAEALLRDQVKDNKGETHDIVVLSHNVADFQARMEQYGLAEAFGE
ncbi:MAG: GNAT family N-acetyltransferase [Gammaproteobacteria bacterium]|nr:GNAT family N-acetyltransferase [Gammaproteobacteria bacterium]